MDVPVSPSVRKRRRTRRWLIISAVAIALALVMLGLSRLQPAAPLVENTYTDTVKRGELLREVRGNGSLVPVDIRWLPTINAGRVESILVLPGARVKSNTVLVELANPEVEQAAFDAGSQLKAAEADQANLRVQLVSQKLTQKAVTATAQANSRAAKLDLEVNEELARSGLVPALILKQSQSKAEEMAKLFEIEQERLKIADDAARAQLAAQDAKVVQLRGQLESKQRQVKALKVRAGMDGVLQRLGDLTNPLQVGQQLAAGAIVARVGNPAKLKAAIKIAETQAKDIQLDQLAKIDTRNGFISGHVIRVDPAVENGTVTVDVSLDAELPKGARPDLSVDGTIQLERLNDVLYVGRPVQALAESTVGLFKVMDGGKTASRVSVKLGRGSVSAIEVVQGLQVGDQVILSDMSQWDRFDRIRLK